jgi:plastocyanin
MCLLTAVTTDCIHVDAAAAAATKEDPMDSKSHEVAIKRDGTGKIVFDPKSLPIKKGDNVTWWNRDVDRLDHRVRFNDDDADQSVLLPPDNGWTKWFESAGTFKTDCSKHSNDVAGEVKVTA